MNSALPMCADLHNYGRGRRMDYAIKTALRELFGEGKYATFHTHLDRADTFLAFLEANGINDLREVSQVVLESYADEQKQLVDDGEREISYAQNLLSTCNVILLALRGDHEIRVSPSEWVGYRSHVRDVPPTGMDWNCVNDCVAALRSHKLGRVSMVVMFARSFGLRLRESCVADINRMIDEVLSEGAFNVQDGTKGGRSAERWIPVEPSQLEILCLALSQSTWLSSNLLDVDQSYISFVRGDIAQARPILREHGIRCFHDLRAAWACEVYQQMTGYLAPVLNPNPSTIPAGLDRQARRTVAYMLGHNRPEVAASYIGGAPR